VTNLQDVSQDVLVVLPTRNLIGIFEHLIWQELEGLCNAFDLAQAQRATFVWAIAGHHLRSSPFGGNPLHMAQPIAPKTGYTRS